MKQYRCPNCKRTRETSSVISICSCGENMVDINKTQKAKKEEKI